MISVSGVLLIIVAGVLAGAVGSAGGITSLVSYPALLAAGVPALAANVANIVALTACWPGSALASRPELQGQAPWLRRWILVTAAGGLLGAALLLCTPARAFARVVPFLVAAGSIALLVQPALRAPAEHEDHRRKPALFAGLLGVSAYGGYFGAGSGIMTLALLLITVDSRLVTANALKNMLIGAGSVISAATLVIFSPVQWAAAVPLAAGLLVGSTIGPVLARRVRPGVLRWLMALLGIGLAVRLWVAPA